MDRVMGRIIASLTSRKNELKIKEKTLWELLQCDYDTLEKHILMQLDHKYTWENYGDLWVLDHVDSVRDAHGNVYLDNFRYSNLEVADKKMNYIKGCRVKRYFNGVSKYNYTHWGYEKF